MTFTATELDYLATQRLGRLATAQPDGTLQVSPVGLKYNPATTTIDIVGYHMAASRKLHNVAESGRVAFVVDDIASVQPWRVRCLEIRGRAEPSTSQQTPRPTSTVRSFAFTRRASSASASTSPTKNPTCSPPTAATSQTPHEAEAVSATSRRPAHRIDK